MESNAYDLVIIGGGVAGAATAATMARAGADVLVLEKETAFKDRVRGEFLAPWGVKDLRALGLLDAFDEAGAIPLPALAGRSLKPRPSRTPEGDVPLSFSHVALQDALLATAIRAGAAVVRGARVTEVAEDGLARVSYTADGAHHEARGRLAVGADGRSSMVRKALGRPERVTRTARVLAGVRLAGVPADPSFGYFIIRESAGALVSLFPQGDGMARAYVFVQGADASTFAGAQGYVRFIDTMHEMGVPREALEGARQAGPLGSFVADDSWVPNPAGHSLVLIGDAAGISDPTWGQGLALAFHDVRTLTDELLRQSDWRAAAQRYARQRDRYFQTVITAEAWLSELQLTPGAEAEKQRNRVMQAWREDPGRAKALDLPAYGPSLDTSAAARAYIFAEDEAPLSCPLPAAASLRPETIAESFLAAVRNRDFRAIGSLFTDTARVRALLPNGPMELHGPEEPAHAFSRWFGDLAEFSVLEMTAGRVADRITMSWRCRLRWHDESFSRVIEQRAYAKVVDGRIAVMDLLCSGFRPEQTGEGLAA